jgi:hypothetical protein
MGILHLFSEQGQLLCSLDNVRRKSGHSFVFTQGGLDLNIFYHAGIFETLTEEKRDTTDKLKCKKIHAYLFNKMLAEDEFGQFFYSDGNVPTLRIVEEQPNVLAKTDSIRTYEFFGKTSPAFTLVEREVSKMELGIY